MLLIGLGLVAVAALVLGLALASSLWLIVSLAASLVALVTLYTLVRRERTSDRKAAKPETEPATKPATKPGADRTDGAQNDSARARPAAVENSSGPAGAAAAQAREQATVTALAGEVLVVDEHPEFHANGCAAVTGRAPSELFAIPLQQALEDGFTPCGTCNPQGTDAADLAQQPGSPAIAEPAPVVAADVWVVDGQPEYHAAGCTRLPGRSAEAIPTTQAVEDGFTPCPACRPETTGAGVAPHPATDAPVRAEEPVGAAAEVWVVDGYPEYHVEVCRQLDGLDKESVPRAQAVEDGFAPCAVCAPDGPSSIPADEVWVADGHPEYHVAGCHELNGREGEPIPRSQALEDGFVACATCLPDAAGTADTADTAGTGDSANTAEEAPEPALAAGGTAGATGTDVWVVDGLPDFHLASCKEIAGLNGEPVSRVHAAEDGFAACPVCRPDVDSAPAQPPSDAPTAADDHTRTIAPVADALPLIVGPTAEAALLEPPAFESVLDEPADVEAAAIAPMFDEPAPDPDPGQQTPGKPSAVDLGPDVFVADGFPDYHRHGCHRLVGMNVETIPFEQAVEDGFAACGVCTPTRENAGTQAPPDSQPPDTSLPHGEPADHVWVVDGRPAYHRENCPTVAGLGGEPIPLPQANEDGFVACDVCCPDDSAEPATMTLPARSARQTAADVRRVWVVDGQPGYHRQECTRLTGLLNTAIPHSQAIEDGFAPCPACRPDDEHAPEPELFVQPEPEPLPVAAFEPEPIAPPEPEPESAPVPQFVPEIRSVSALEPVAATVPAGAPHAGPSSLSPTVSTDSGEEPALAAQVVYVLDGRPRFHAADCLIIKDLGAQPVPYDKAVSDGLSPCSLCSR